MFYFFDICREMDFNKLRRLTSDPEKSNKIVINIIKDINFRYPFECIDLEGYDVIINGNNHKLSNINIANPYEEESLEDFTGMFSKVDNLYIYNLNIENSNIYGKVKCGTLAGHIDNELELYNVNANNLYVESEAFAGGIAGRCKEVYIIDSSINSEVYGHDVVGGVVGMTDKYTEEYSEINSNGIAFGKAIGNEAGYCELKRRKKDTKYYCF